MKHLCELSKKGVDKNIVKILAVVTTPEYLCMKCARVSSKKERLCKPSKIESLLDQ
jgi:hypothetical protein